MTISGMEKIHFNKSKNIYGTLLLIFFLLMIAPNILYAQKENGLTKNELTGIYTQAIADFIKTANARNKSKFDTLYFIKRANGQPDDFPDISLPKIIENTNIQLIDHKAAEKVMNSVKTRKAVNLIGWTDRKKAEFIFVVFSDGFTHQYDYNINYKYNRKIRKFEPEKIEFKGPPFK